MLPDLQKRFDSIERQRAALGGSALALDAAQLNWSPDADTWSVRQIVEHLVLSDETVGRAKDAGVVESEARMFRILPRASRRVLVLSAFRRDTALPLPSPAVEPRGDVPLPGLLARWEGIRTEMRLALDPLRGDEPRYSHPVLGPLTAGQMLELGRAHTAYHARQIEKLRRDPAFPQHSPATKETL